MKQRITERHGRKGQAQEYHEFTIRAPYFIAQRCGENWIVGLRDIDHAWWFDNTLYPSETAARASARHYCEQYQLTGLLPNEYTAAKSAGWMGLKLYTRVGELPPEELTNTGVQVALSLCQQMKDALEDRNYALNNEDAPDEEDEDAPRIGAMVHCTYCHEPTNPDTAHWHQGGYVGDTCCWDERLRATE